MDRLTISGFDYDRDFIASHLQSWSIAQAVKRLAAYEDTGLTPDEIVAIKAKLGEFSEAFKGAQAVCEVAISEKKQAIAERDRFKARAEAAERDIRALSDEFKICRFCKHDRGGGIWDCKDSQCDAKNHYEWRGPQEGAADVECSAKPESRYPTWREWQSATFPDAGSNMRPCAFGLSCDGVSCLQCPDRTIPADIAKKLGVEPIREDK